jgi:membrane-bound serine protease (ClpP class)
MSFNIQPLAFRFFITAGLFCFYLSVFSQDKKIMVLKIREEIGPRINRYVSMGMNEAKKINANYILVDMDTYGGTLNDADEIRKAFLDSSIPVYVFINKNAASAGALISIACDSIYMAPGSNIGAATVVTEDGKPAPDKYQSYMRSLMRSTAQARKRNPQIAEQMVGQFFGKDSATIGKVLSFSTQEAIENKYCEAQVNGFEEILSRNGIKNYVLVPYGLSMTERIIGYFLSPYLRSILILLIIAGIYFELQSPGIGFALLTSVVAALLYFIPSYMNGLAENWEILVFLIGLVLLILEIFVIPGFGIAGIAGIVCTLGGLILVMLNNDFLDFTFVNTNSLSEAIIVLLVAIIGGIFLAFFAGPIFLQSKLFKRVTLQESFETSAGYTSNFNVENMIGKTGVAYTVLRPSGKIEINHIIYDAYSQGDFIDRGSEVIVIDHLATSLKVKLKS